MVKHTQTILRQQPTNCLSVFDHFVGLGIKGLSRMIIQLMYRFCYRNWMLNFGLFFETAPVAFLQYTQGLSEGLRLCPMNFPWWFLGFPFSLLIFVYDECRRFFLRRNPGGKFQSLLHSVESLL